MQKFLTAECVTEGHPDKLCDIIADRILDDCLRHDPQAHVACEVLASGRRLVVAGEISGEHVPEAEGIARGTFREIGYPTDDLDIKVWLRRQSPDIASGVSRALEDRDSGENEYRLGAGDQGIAVGYACNETHEKLPLPVVLARNMASALTEAYHAGEIPGIGPDGKVQVTVEYEDHIPVRLDTVVVSIQHEDGVDPEWLFREVLERIIRPQFRLISADEDTLVLVNPSGRFVIGGPQGDTGLTGRKLMVDSYGPLVPHGGGAYSGKDPTKTDRSGAYMARYIAKNIVAARLADRCQVTLAYAIGVANPIMVQVDTFGTASICADDTLALAVQEVFDLTPDGIMRTLRLQRPIYANTARYGHFGVMAYPWEQTDKIRELLDTVR